MDQLTQSGRIFDIQRFSLHDGNGIRTIIFLKGCVLRCRWCCNPESQSYEIQRMVIDGEEKIIGRDITVTEVMEIVEKDRPYYRRSDGGLTLSGGECLNQPEFTLALLKETHERGINTAVESMGGVEYQIIASVLPYIDQFLLDIKHMNPVKFKEYTGKDNRLILENASKIAASGQTELSIRIPVVPGFNATRAEIEAIARFTGDLKTVKRIHLLPYHRLGQDKYTGLGREYLMKDTFPPDEGWMAELLRIAEKTSGVKCQIGG